MQKTCPYAKKCGGCDYTEIDYEKSLELKKQRVAELLKPFCKVDRIIGMENPYYYRNKVTTSFGMDNKKHPVAGIYQQHSHKIIEISECLIEDKQAQAVAKSIIKLLPSFKIRVYDENTGYGLLKYVQIRKGHNSGQIMVTLVTASPIFPSKNNFCKALRKLHPEVETIVQNINDRTDSLVLANRENVLYGKGFIEDTLCGRKFRISSKSFYQVNTEQTEILYSEAIKFANLSGKETVLDAYCGIGTIGIIASDSAGRVIGVESNRDAIRDAIINAKTNKIANITFVSEDAGSFMEKAAAENAKVDVVIMDPPRNGSDEKFINSVAKLAPERVVYISCGPESLANDLKVFAKCGYRAKKAECVDMFPFSTHVESVVLLERM